MSVMAAMMPFDWHVQVTSVGVASTNEQNLRDHLASNVLRGECSIKISDFFKIWSFVGTVNWELTHWFLAKAHILDLICWNSGTTHEMTLRWHFNGEFWIWCEFNLHWGKGKWQWLRMVQVTLDHPGGQPGHGAEVCWCCHLCSSYKRK